MPFQISLHSNVKQRGIINSFNAGIDQHVPCAFEVTLTATVNGNLQGHTVLWEQLSGDTQIVFVTPVNQTTVTYNIVGGGSSDRLFRFYIDKGTPLEQFDDVVVWGTPTETEPYSYYIPPAPTSIDTECRNIPCSSIITRYDVFPTPSEQGTTVVNPTTGFSLIWTSPTCDSQYFIGTDVVQNTGVLTTIATVLPTQPQLASIPDLYGVYYLYVNYVVDGTPYTQFSCRSNIQSTGDTVNIYATDTSDTYNIQTVTQAVYYSLIAESSSLSTYDVGYSVASNLSATYFSLIAEPSPLSVEGVSSVINNNNVVYYSNNGIGG